MKKVHGFLAGFGVLGVLAFFALWLFLLVSSFYGLYLAFSASIVLGIIVIFVQPSPLVIGLVMLFFHKDLAQLVIDFLSK